MELLYGKPVAERILTDTKKRIGESGIVPGLSVILVGDDAPSHLYVGLKEKAAAEIGVRFEKFLFPETVDAQEVFRCIEEQNARPDVHGIIVQLPLPIGFPTDEIIARIDPKKDTDGFHHATVRRFLGGDASACPVFPRAIIELLRSTGRTFHGMKGIVLAHSEIFGKIMSQALSFEGLDADYSLADLGNSALAEALKEASVVVTVRGFAQSVSGDMLHKDVAVIDGGISISAGHVVGDIDFESVRKVASYLSPVPGGVGPVTVATLLARVAEVAVA
jgi:methylenetetrahydrofolate dehydrogenase (NADP+) / methenyltetrahydrofolate cyclohydrolase